MLENYFKIAWRNLWKNKVFSAVNIFGLSLGIACALLIIFHIKEELAYDRGFSKSDRIFRITQQGLGDDTRHWAATAPPLAMSIQQSFSEVEQTVRLHRPYPYQVFSYTPSIGIPNRFEERGGFFADSNLLEIFDLQFIHGDPKKALSQIDAIVITKKMARKYFGDENPLGKSIQDDQAKLPLTVTGVVKEFDFPTHLKFDYLLSMGTIYKYLDRQSLERRTWNGFYTYVLLKEGHSRADIEKRFPDLMVKFYEPAGESREEILSSRKFHLQPITDIHLRSKLEKEMHPNSDITYVYIFSIAALFILVVAAINFINIYTAHALKRMKEIGVRKVIGATRWQLMIQFLGESFLITLFAALLGLLIFKESIPFYNNLSGKDFEFQHLLTFPNLFIILVLIISIALSAGFFPAWFVSHFNTITSLKGQKNVASPVNTVRKGLIVFQFVVAVFMIFSTIVIYRQMRLFHNKHLGFDKEQVIAVTMYGEMWEKFGTLINYIKQNKNIAGFATVSTLPGERFGMHSFSAIGTDNNGLDNMRAMWGDDRLLETLGIPLKEGRNFISQFPEIKHAEYILNEAAVKALHFKKAIGNSVVLEGDTGNVVGVVKDFNFASLHSPVEPLVIKYNPYRSNYLLLKVEGNGIPQTLQYMESKVRMLSPSSQFSYSFIDDNLNRLYDAENRMSQIFKAFACFAILISCLGLFGLSAYSAQLRIKEVGIRKVLGASTTRVAFMLTNDFIKLVTLATFISWPIAWFVMSRWLDGFAYRININLWVFVLSGAFAILVAMCTVSFQAIKAAMLNPTKSIKSE